MLEAVCALLVLDRVPGRVLRWLLDDQYHRTDEREREAGTAPDLSLSLSLSLSLHVQTISCILNILYTGDLYLDKLMNPILLYVVGPSPLRQVVVMMMTASNYILK